MNQQLTGRGIVILYDDFSPIWLDWMHQGGLNVLGLHGLPDNHTSNVDEDAFLQWVQKEENRSLVKQFEADGITVEYELHVASWLLPRSYFEQHPTWFRMDREGKRTNDFNFCPSSAEALAVVRENAFHLAEILQQKSHNYYFWLDDKPDTSCHCTDCRTLSGADQNLLIMNEILKGLRRYDPEARLAYLAYSDALSTPQIRPAEGIFLEFAPMHRDHTKPITDAADPRNITYARLLLQLADRFDLSQAHILEYWLDNALYSDYQKPPVKVPFEETVMERDVAFYRSLGIDFITSFGAFLNEEYQALHGTPPIRRYGEILNGQ